MKKIITIVLVLVIMFLTVDVWSQCPMCRAAAGSNLAQGGTEGKGLNTGILYMLTLPYLLIGTIGYLFWKNRNKDAETQ